MCDEVNEEDAVHQVDKVDEVHQVDPAHQVNRVGEVHQVHPLDPVFEISQYFPCVHIYFWSYNLYFLVVCLFQFLSP